MTKRKTTRAQVACCSGSQHAPSEKKEETDVDLHVVLVVFTTQALPPACFADRFRDHPESNTSSCPLLLLRLSFYISSRHPWKTQNILPTNPSALDLCFFDLLINLQSKLARSPTFLMHVIFPSQSHLVLLLQHRVPSSSFGELLPPLLSL